MKENNSNRTCLVTGEEKNKEELLRFTLTPDRQVIPDFKKKLPGKGFYITNSRAVLAQAVSKNVFKKFGKNTKVDPNLGETVENIWENLQKGRVAFIIEAADAGSDGNAKIRAAAGNTEILTLFEVEELDKALNRTNTVHAAVLKGGMAEMVRSQLRKWQNFNS